jgi:hypothetical protein
MKKISIYFFIVLAVATGFMISPGCKKTTNVVYKTDSLTDYLALQPGKSITYRLDSTNYTFFGTIITVTSYYAQDVVDTIILDDLGRPSWRVFRYITDTAQLQPWADLETYLITPTLGAVEVNENNLRFIKLSLPLTNGFSWPGNSYIDTSPPASASDADYSYLDGWNYTYDSIGAPYTVLAGAIPNSLIVRQQNYAGPDTTNLLAFSQLNYSVEVYSKGIGLIYKDFLHWSYQPPNGGNAAGSKSGYGIRLNMIGHN